MEDKPRKLVDEEEIKKVTKLGRLGLPGLTKIIMDILRLSTLNDLYEKLGNDEGLRFIDAVFKELEVDFDYFEEELSRIPKEGPFVVVANHPLGGIDGIILIRLISLIRPDFKVMANFLLQKIEPIKDYFLPVNPFEDRKEARSSFTGIKESMAYVREGHGLGIFPAGEVSTYNFEEGRVIDRPWQNGAIRLIQRLDVPVIPVYFKAKNSRLFYMLSALSPTLRTARLPSELLHQKGKNIVIRVGRAITPEEYQREDVEETNSILRERTYRLANALEKERKFPVLLERKPKDPEPIMEPVPRDLIHRDIERLKNDHGPLTVFRDYEVFCATAVQAPNVLLEIGRLREITFREVGEGTNLPQDIDGYDQHYLHLFLWDNKEKLIVGAYRLGMGADIYEKFGINGFYVHSLFRVDKELHGFMSQSLEMGRAFVVKEYQ
ncbi:MAG: lysophospholipid acyltransferase family protein, partial [Bacteroidota bacterium]|nr:lysophospholipid acyltransferase family protein [Bacteroidota bacterium]